MIICQGVPIMHHFERFTVDLDEKLGDSLLECPQLYHSMGFPGDPQNGIIRGMVRSAIKKEKRQSLGLSLSLAIRKP